MHHQFPVHRLIGIGFGISVVIATTTTTTIIIVVIGIIIIIVMIIAIIMIISIIIVVIMITITITISVIVIIVTNHDEKDHCQIHNCAPLCPTGEETGGKTRAAPERKVAAASSWAARFLSITGTPRGPWPGLSICW